MNNLVSVVSNQVFTDSIVIAQGTGIEHRKIKDRVKQYEKELKKFGLLTSYQAESTGGRPETYYRLGEEQATFLITLLKNTPVVVKFKAELVKQFYAMRIALMEKQSIQWQQTRVQSKTVRKGEGVAINDFVNYARDQGSKNADRYFCNLSRLANKAAGISERDDATAIQLNMLMVIENMFGQIIREGIKQEVYYKDIFQMCKQKVELFSKMLSLEISA